MEESTLRNDRYDNGEYSRLTAKADAEKLVLEGVDGGGSVSEIYGDYDYEYWITVTKEHYPKLIVKLLEKLYAEKVFKISSHFKKFCEENGIETDFKSYV